MKTQNKTLGFRKNSVVELQNHELLNVNGGTSPATSTIPCAGAVAAVVVAGINIVHEAGVAVGEAISREID